MYLLCPHMELPSFSPRMGVNGNLFTSLYCQPSKDQFWIHIYAHCHWLAGKSIICIICEQLTKLAEYQAAKPLTRLKIAWYIQRSFQFYLGFFEWHKSEIPQNSCVGSGQWDSLEATKKSHGVGLQERTLAVFWLDFDSNHIRSPGLEPHYLVLLWKS